MSSSWLDSWSSAWGNSWGTAGTVVNPLLPFLHLSRKDIRYEALIRVVTPSDANSMLREYWKGLFGGSGSTSDILYEGAVLGLANPQLKDYYDNITGTVWPDHNSSERQYWLQILSNNL